MDPRRDPVTGSIISEAEHQRDLKHWLARSQSFVATLDHPDPSAFCALLYTFLDEQSRGSLGARPTIPLCDHAPDSYVADHALLTSAIAYCLGHDRSDIHLIRLAALSHEFPADVQTQLAAHIGGSSAVELEQAWAMLSHQTTDLLGALSKSDSLTAFAAQPALADERLALLWYAHLTASQPLFNQLLPMADGTVLSVIRRGVDFDHHPLRHFSGSIGLVYGGATKIKEYVFESAKLPEIRGGSTLLDRLNQEKTRALFAAAPECVIYANGGDLLALAPPALAQTRADEIEACYTHETLTAQSVAVAAGYNLLEFQYGLQPQTFWADDYLNQLRQAEPVQVELLRSYYGDPGHERWSRWSDEMLFHRRKSFGELATQLALKRLWRREGNGGKWQQHDPQPARILPYFETHPHGQYCNSCDRRIAVVQVRNLGDVLCDSCRRKRCMGWRMRRGEQQSADALLVGTTWRPDASPVHPWYEQFQQYLDQGEATERKSHYLHGLSGANWQALDITVPLTLNEIGQAANPQQFIGLVYADGNNVGAIIEKIRTASFYRQFATRLFEATKAAVFAALAHYLRPTSVKDDKGKPKWIHPFEIVGIGGDDLFLIVPADKALPIAQHIATHIETCFSNDDPEYGKKAQSVQRYRPHSFQPTGRPQVSLSAGVVLAAENTPIFFLKELVEDLLKSAKSAAKQRKEKGYYGSTVDFMALKAVSMVTSSVDEFRETALTEAKWPTLDLDDGNQLAGQFREVLHLTARPYTLHEVEGMLQTVASLKAIDFPRSQLYQLREALPQGRFVSSLNYLYFSSRLRLVDSTLLRHVLDRAWCKHLQEPVPWRLQRQADVICCDPARKLSVQHWETILADVVELYDFVPAADRTQVLEEMRRVLEELKNG